MNRALKLLGVLCLVAAAPAYAHGTQCSDATAQNVYTASRYDGGAPPPPQLDTLSETASVAGQSLGQNLYSEAAGWRNQFNATVSVQSDLGTKQDQSTNSVTHTYVANLTLATLEGVTKFSGLVICADTGFLIPPP